MYVKQKKINIGIIFNIGPFTQYFMIFFLCSRAFKPPTTYQPKYILHPDLFLIHENAPFYFVLFFWYLNIVLLKKIKKSKNIPVKKYET